MNDSGVFVGIAASRSSVDVATYPHIQAKSFSGDLSKGDILIEHLRTLTPCLIIIEDAEGIAAPLAGMLYDAGLPVGVGRFRQGVEEGLERARALARFAGGIKLEFRKEGQKLSELVAFRRGQMTLIQTERKRLSKASQSISKHIYSNIANLQKELKRTDEDLAERVRPPWRVNDNLLQYVGQKHERQERPKPSPLPCVPYIKAWIQPNLRKAAKWSLVGHLLLGLIAWPILARSQKEERLVTVRIVRFSDLGPPPSIVEKGPSREASRPNTPPPAQMAQMGKVNPRPTMKPGRVTGKIGTPIPVKASEAPVQEEWKSPEPELPAELPPGEGLSVHKSSFQEGGAGGVAVRQDLSDQKKMTAPKPSVPDERVSAKPEQGDRKKVTLRLSLLGGYSGVSGKIAYIQRALEDMRRVSFSFRDATIRASKTEARVGFDDGRSFAVYFGADWRLGRMEIDMESQASDRDREAQALRAIDFLERALKSQSN